MRLTLKHNLDAMFAVLEANLGSKLPIAVGKAIAKTGEDVRLALRDEMATVFDRPTPYTLNSVKVEHHYTRLRSTVWLNDESSGGGHAAAEYLIPEISGGLRVEKRSEYLFRQAGILPPGMSIVPAPSAERDQYGSIKSGLIKQILSALRLAETVAGRTANRPVGTLNSRQRRARRKQGDFFVAHSNRPHGRHLHPGIYRRFESGGAIEAILLFVPAPRYTGIFDFERVAQETADISLPAHLRDQIAASVRTN